MLIAIWHMGTNGRLYDDSSVDYCNQLHPERAKTGDLPTRGHGLPRHSDLRQLNTDAEEIFAPAGAATSQQVVGPGRHPHF
jgi:hypothetical protein